MLNNLQIPGWKAASVAGFFAMGLILPFRLFSAPSTPWPELSYPPKTEVEWVATDAVVNGLPVQIQHVTSELSPAELLGYYRALWAGKPGGHSDIQAVGDWQYINTMQGPVNIAVQVKKKDGSDGSEGQISMANVIEAKADYLPESWPKGLDVKTIQFMESVDGPRRSYFLTARSDRSLDGSLNHIVDAFRYKGWKVQQQRKIALPKGDSFHVLMGVQGFDKTLDITVLQPVEQAPVMVSVSLVQPASEQR